METGYIEAKGRRRGTRGKDGVRKTKGGGKLASGIIRGPGGTMRWRQQGHRRSQPKERKLGEGGCTKRD